MRAIFVAGTLFLSPVQLPAGPIQLALNSAVPSLSAINTPPTVSAAGSKSIEQRVSDLEKKPKDIWDIITAISGLGSGLLVAVVGGGATYIFSRRDRAAQIARAKESLAFRRIEIVEKMLPHLTTENALEKRAALVVISALKDDELAIRLAEVFPGPGALAAIMRIASSKDGGAHLAQVSLLRTFSSVVNATFSISIGLNRVATGLGTEFGLATAGGPIWDRGSGSNDPDEFATNNGGEVSRIVGLKKRLKPGQYADVALLHGPRDKMINVATATPLHGDQMLVISRARDRKPTATIAQFWSDRIEVELESFAIGSPVINDAGELLGLLDQSYSYENGMKWDLISYAKIVDFAGGFGVVTSRSDGSSSFSVRPEDCPAPGTAKPQRGRPPRNV